MARELKTIDGGKRFGALSGQVMPPEPKYREQTDTPEKHAPHHAWRAALIAVMITAPICYAAGWLSYDLAVKATIDNVQEQVTYGEIARRLADGDGQ